MRVEVETLGGFAPVQATGRIGESFFYFRSRHRQWSFQVARTREGAGEDEGLLWRESAPWGEGAHAASFMPHDEAMRIIERCAIAYAAQLMEQVS